MSPSVKSHWNFKFNKKNLETHQILPTSFPSEKLKINIFNFSSVSPSVKSNWDF
jgi:hypothetical protein